VKQKSYLKKEEARKLLLKPNVDMPIKGISLHTKTLESIRPLANNERLATWAQRYYATGQHKRV
jgi:hypothetical protein